MNDLTSLRLSFSGNDLKAEGLKIGGILIDAFHRNHVEWSAIGIGLNVNSRLSDFPPYLEQRANTIFECLGEMTPRDRLLSKILERFDEAYTELLRAGPNALLARAGPWVATGSTRTPEARSFATQKSNTR